MSLNFNDIKNCLLIIINADVQFTNIVQYRMKCVVMNYIALCILGIHVYLVFSTCAITMEMCFELVVRFCYIYIGL